MGEMKDVVIGFITDYTDYNKIKPYVNSLNMCGFTGDKIMVVYNIGYDIVSKLQEEGLNVIGFEHDDVNNRFVYKQKFNIVVSRFLHIWQILKPLKDKYRYVISVDVADVVFQRNPSEYLEEALSNYDICVGCENLNYKDEAWGIHNMYQSFGDIATSYIQDRPIYNAGTIAGKFDTFLDFCYNIFLLCQGAPMNVLGGGGPDQAAMNLLLSLSPYKNITNFKNHNSSWSCQCGTTVDPNKIDGFRPNLLTKEEPVMKEDGCVYNSHDYKYVLVHQYNRVPEWNKIIKSKYDY
jgi:hypothetical protein